MNVKYYKVVVMRGHMGSNYDHMISAMDNARKHGGVKHNRLPANAVEITAEEYYANRGSNAYDRACCRKDKGVVFSFLRLFK